MIRIRNPLGRRTNPERRRKINRLFALSETSQLKISVKTKETANRTVEQDCSYFIQLQLAPEYPVQFYFAEKFHSTNCRIQITRAHPTNICRWTTFPFYPMRRGRIVVTRRQVVKPDSFQRTNVSNFYARCKISARPSDETRVSFFLDRVIHPCRIFWYRANEREVDRIVRQSNDLSKGRLYCETRTLACSFSRVIRRDGRGNEGSSPKRTVKGAGRGAL